MRTTRPLLLVALTSAILLGAFEFLEAGSGLERPPPIVPMASTLPVAHVDVRGAPPGWYELDRPVGWQTYYVTHLEVASVDRWQTETVSSVDWLEIHEADVGEVFPAGRTR